MKRKRFLKEFLSALGAKSINYTSETVSKIYGIVNYDLRERNKTIQTNTEFAIICIQEIQKNLDKPNKEMELHQIIEGEKISITSNYYRELLYNLEHCIHHQALLKVALLPLKKIKIESDFGVARSTIAYRNSCVQ